MKNLSKAWAILKNIDENKVKVLQIIRIDNLKTLILSKS